MSVRKGAHERMLLFHNLLIIAHCVSSLSAARSLWRRRVARLKGNAPGDGRADCLAEAVELHSDVVAHAPRLVLGELLHDGQDVCEGIVAAEQLRERSAVLHRKQPHGVLVCARIFLFFERESEKKYKINK